jgi:hypothetical protein
MSTQVPRASARYLRAVIISGACVLAAVCAGTPGAGRHGDPREVSPASPGTAPPPAAARGEPRGPVAGSRDLGRDEQRGGHTLARHVGRNDADLAARLRRERNIPAASTWSDRDTAERIVGATLGRSRTRLEGWTAPGAGRPNLALDWRGTHPVGRSLRRGAPRSDVVSCATVVLRWSVPDGDFYVLTSYPEACR